MCKNPVVKKPVLKKTVLKIFAVVWMHGTLSVETGFSVQCGYAFKALLCVQSIT